MSAPAVEGLRMSLAEPERWFLPASHPGDYVFADPLTHQQLSPNQPPVWIRRDPVLGAGFDYLESRGQDIAVTLALGRHGDAEDLGNPSRRWFEKQVCAADYYAYENYSGSSKDTREIQSRARFIAFAAKSDDIQARIERELKCSGFTARRLAAVALSGTPSFAFDTATDSGIAEAALLPVLQSEAFAEQTVEAGLAAVNGQNMREWIMVGKMGVMLACHERGRERPLNVFATMGACHADLTRKVRLYGPQVTPKRIMSPESVKLEPIDMQGMFRSGVVLRADLEDVATIHREVTRSMKETA